MMPREQQEIACSKRALLMMCNFLKSHNWSLESDLMTHLVSRIEARSGLGKRILINFILMSINASDFVLCFSGSFILSMKVKREKSEFP